MRAPGHTRDGSDLVIPDILIDGFKGDRIPHDTTREVRG